ncbi:flagellar export protein FliJ [Halomonas sp. YLGW01]|uniref:flagellar export protein FliJ n=1 Tax=Halomonas sp. YLGW01 TaxID=2773308 RepID=UPI00177CA15F|nr:flagellar export protein FliJ [Halomonas sp. YLGW01]
MTGSRPLETLAQLAKDARDAASQALASERRGEQQAARQVETLRQYRLEYAHRLQQAMHGGIDPASLHNYQQFLASLDTAIDRAHQAQCERTSRVESCQRQWQQQQRRLSSYDTLHERRQAEAQREAQRREQRHNDELSANCLARRPPDHRIR